MVRTQVYLTAQERDGLARLTDLTGKKQSELIREAIDRFIEESGARRREAILDRAAGIWKDRDDLPDLRVTRRGWDRD